MNLDFTHALLNGVISHNFKSLSKIWRGIFATAELFVLIEFHMTHDGSNLLGISPGDALKRECSSVAASCMMLSETY